MYTDIDVSYHLNSLTHACYKIRVRDLRIRMWGRSPWVMILWVTDLKLLAVVKREVIIVPAQR